MSNSCCRETPLSSLPRPTRSLSRFLGAAVAAVILVGAWAPVALAKSFELPAAKVSAVVNRDGSVDITERITFAFSGSFSGAYRDIPSVDEARVVRSSVQVGIEGGPQYSVGGGTELGTPGPIGSYAVGDPDEFDGTRIVWRFALADTNATFVIQYTLVGAVRLYSDTAELNLRVWGDHWEQRLQSLEAVIETPLSYDGDAQRWRVWGNSSSTPGFTEFTTDGARLISDSVPPNSFVEFRMLFPREAIDPNSDLVDVRKGAGFQKVIAEEKAEEAKLFRAEERQRWLLENLVWLILLTLTGAVLPAAFAFAWIGRTRGRDPETSTPEYLQSPPSELTPGEVALLGKEHGDVGPQAFVATLFDLMRRGWFRVTHELTERKTWGGLRTENVSDLRIYSKNPPNDSLTSFEQLVFDAVEPHAGDKGVLLGALADKWTSDSKAFYSTFEAFKTDLSLLRVSKGWVKNTGSALRDRGALIAALVLLAGIPVGIWEVSRYGFPIFGVVLGTIGLGNVALLAILSGMFPDALTARTPSAAKENAEWNAFRKFISDFTMLSEQPPVAIELWERILVYAIVFGVAENVLSVAQLKAPPELAESSSVFWLDSHGSGLGSGASLLNINHLYAGVSAAHTSGMPKPTTSSASGFGGGFSGGGGGGGVGGGGGGAW